MVFKDWLFTKALQIIKVFMLNIIYSCQFLIHVVSQCSWYDKMKYLFTQNHPIEKININMHLHLFPGNKPVSTDSDYKSSLMYHTSSIFQPFLCHLNQPNGTITKQTFLNSCIDSAIIIQLMKENININPSVINPVNKSQFLLHLVQIVKLEFCRL